MDKNGWKNINSFCEECDGYINISELIYFVFFFHFSIISEIVDEAIDNNTETALNEDDSVKSVFHSILCEKDLDIRDKKSAIIDFIAAGIETLANTLIFVLHYVTSSRIRALDRIKEEFENCPKEIESNSLAQAVFTKACLQETYRICPTAFCLARILQEDTCLSGYNIKAGVKSINEFLLFWKEVEFIFSNHKER